MRIAIVTKNARVVGGVESYLDTVIPLLEAAGHEIALLYEYDAPHASRPIGRSVNVPLWCMREIGEVRSLNSIWRWCPDLIYTHGLSDPEFEARVLVIAPAIAFAHDYRATCISGAKAFAFPAATPCGRSFGAGCLANFYPRRCGGLNPLTMLTDFRRAARRLELLRSCRGVLTASEFVRAEYVRNGFAPGVVHCVGLPVVDRSGLQSEVSARETSDLPAGSLSAAPLRLLFVGRMEPLKGGRILLDALPLVASALSRPLVLTFAGDGSARVEWARRADTLNQRDPALRVEFHGWVEPAMLARLFDGSDLLVVPSLWPEPFGLVGPEAGMRGLPAAAFATGGIPEWLTDGANGALASDLLPTPANFADAIVRCLRDPVEHARLRLGAIELAHRFDPERHLKALTKVIHQIVPQVSARIAAQTSSPTEDPPVPAESSSVGAGAVGSFTLAAPGGASLDVMLSANPYVQVPRAKRRPRRILSIGHSYCVALNRRLAHEMARVGGADWEVTAVAPAFFPADLRAIECERSAGELCGLEAIPAYLTSRIHMFVYGRRLRELTRENCDLVHCWEEPYILAGAEIAWWTPREVPLVFWTMQNIAKHYPPPFSLIEKYCFDRCAGWFGSGRLVVEAMLDRGYGATKPHRVMPIGVDIDRFRPDAAAREATRIRLGWDKPDPPVAGFAGRFIEGKGLHLMMRALDRIGEPWRALFIGGGPLEPELRGWAARYGDRVRILTDVTHDQVPAHLNAMDLLCAPSQTTDRWREQFGRMVIEAFACGVPVISSDSGELPYVMGDAGVIAGERDENAWVSAIKRLLGNRSARVELSCDGIERARSTYAWPIIAHNHLEFFSQLLDGGFAS